MRALLVFFIFFNLALGDNITLLPAQVMQGHSFKVLLQSKYSRSNVKILFNKDLFPLYPVTVNKTQVIMGVSYEVAPGTYPVKAVLTGKSKNIVLAQANLTVVSANFKKSVLTISSKKEKEGATDFGVLDQENVILGKAFRSSRIYKYWRGKFLPPLKKQVVVSSPYGSQRIYKNEKGKIVSTWAHRGIDYAAAVGTPVYATNSGIIMVSRSLQVHGSTIMIDHGQGIVSVYNHLYKRLVKNGVWVNKGQLIGYSGNTGLTTGANLHYGLSVNNVRINPLEWFEKEF